MKVKVPVHKNEEYPAKVVDLSYEGNGVVKIDDFPVFVPNALQGRRSPSGSPRWLATSPGAG